MRILMLSAALLLPGIALANGFQRHEVMSGSPVPYDFNHRSAYNAATLQEQRRRGCGCGGGGGGGAFGFGEASSSYAVGNWTQINMTLGENANGMINIEEHQSNWGSATATSNLTSTGAAPGSAAATVREGSGEAAGAGGDVGGDGPIKADP